MPAEDESLDIISAIATIGAPLLTCCFLLYWVINSHWHSVAFMAIIFVTVIIIYWRLIGPDDEDDDFADESLPTGREANDEQNHGA